MITVATGRLMLGFRKWYYNMCGFNKLGKAKGQCQSKHNTTLTTFKMTPLHEKLYMIVLGEHGY